MTDPKELAAACRRISESFAASVADLAETLRDFRETFVPDSLWGPAPPPPGSVSPEGIYRPRSAGPPPPIEEVSIAEGSGNCDLPRPKPSRLDLLRKLEWADGGACPICDRWPLVVGLSEKYPDYRRGHAEGCELAQALLEEVAGPAYLRPLDLQALSAVEVEPGSPTEIGRTAPPIDVASTPITRKLQATIELQCGHQTTVEREFWGRIGLVTVSGIRCPEGCPGTYALEFRNPDLPDPESDS